MGDTMFVEFLITWSDIDYYAAMCYQPGYPVMNKPDTIIEGVKEEIHLKFLVRMQMYYINKMIPNWIFLIKVFGYSDLRYIFAVRKGGAIAQSVEQWTENPCVPGSIPGGTTSLNRKSRKINFLRVFVFNMVTELMTNFVTYTLSRK